MSQSSTLSLHLSHSYLTGNNLTMTAHFHRSEVPLTGPLWNKRRWTCVDFRSKQTQICRCETFDFDEQRGETGHLWRESNESSNYDSEMKVANTLYTVMHLSCLNERRYTDDPAVNFYVALRRLSKWTYLASRGRKWGSENCNTVREMMWGPGRG
jgi:hypothetical protein